MKIDNFPEKYRNDILNAKNLLKNEGCGSVFVFGSLVTGKYHDNSDIDIGISGLHPSKFFRVYGQLFQKLDAPFDLVDFDEKKDLYELLFNLGEIVEVE